MVSIVSDSSPIISWARAGKLELLQKLVKELVIPEAVYKEIVIDGKGKPGSEEIEKATWVKREQVKKRDKVNDLRGRFGPGESEAIVLASEIDAILLIDEHGAHDLAKSIGLRIITTLTLVRDAKDRGLISSVKELLEELKAGGFRASSELIVDSTIKAGEVPDKGIEPDEGC